MSDLIKREDAIKAVAQDLMYESCIQSEYASDELSDWIEVAKVMLEEVPSADRPQDDEFKNFDRESLILLIEAQKERIGELLADRPQGEWVDKGKNLWKCSNCEMVIYSESEQDRNEFHKWCSRCGARMKGADDERL